MNVRYSSNAKTLNSDDDNIDNTEEHRGLLAIQQLESPQPIMGDTESNKNKTCIDVKDLMN